MFFNIFSNKDWQRKIIPSISADNKFMSINIKNLICLEDANSGKKKFIGDYGHYTSEILLQTFKNSESTIALFKSNNNRVQINLGEDSKIKKEITDIPEDHILEIHLKKSELASNMEEFRYELLELIISALENSGTNDAEKNT